ncbi:MAG TPA: IS481 family transposase [Thermoanaerobaculia bacterium]|nr:IS481 family transposase [Thermoanaerobaculia bacterium]
MNKSRPGGPTGKRPGPGQRPGGSGYPLELRLRAVEEIIRQGAPYQDVARAYGVGTTTLSAWVRSYRLQGVEGLKAIRVPAQPDQRPKADPRHQAVGALRREHPEYGTRRIRDILARFEALGVSETEVRRILHDEGLLESRPATAPREHPERRFERAEPNQLWQSDIFTFLLRKHQRVYVAVFMDDHSRFIVGHALAHHQKSELVMEAFERGIAAFGAPREILTDQGRQYTAWRGTTEFEQELRREGIRHIKSRPQHPQTLGKVERFWKTLWEEFLSRTVFADFADLERRLSLFIDAYNFQRPHQALGGLVPADRFFRAAPHVREAIEKNIDKNALRLAQQQPVEKPFYLVGRLGDRDLSIAASEDGLRVQMGDETPRTINLRREVNDESKERPARLERTESAARAADAEVAADERAGRDGQEALPSGPVGPERGDARLSGHRGSTDLTRDLLPARDAGAVRHAPGPDAGSREYGGGRAARGPDGSHGDPRQEAREGEAARRAAPAPHEASPEAGTGHDGQGPPNEAGSEIDDHWKRAFGGQEEGRDLDERKPFDPESDWHGRAVIWDRKLAGENAGPPEAPHGQAQEKLRPDPARAAFGERPVRSGPLGDIGRNVGEPGGPQAGPLADSLPDPDAPGPRRDDREPLAGKARAAGEESRDGLFPARERAPLAREPSPPWACRDDRETPRGGEQPPEGRRQADDPDATEADESDHEPRDPR